MEYLSGFLIGFLGSFHCIGMCGPLAISIPRRKEGRLPLIADTLFYNGGRILTYTLIGAFAGSVGSSLGIAGIQEKLSLVIGAILLLTVIIPRKAYSPLMKHSFIQNYIFGIKTAFQKYFQKSGIISILIIGILNGFLPCGLVYVALGTSLTFADPLNSGLFMLFFGLGTLPSMAFIFSFKNIISIEFRRRINRLLPFGVALVATLLILRGLSLGIPYISPALTDSINKKQECCH